MALPIRLGVNIDHVATLRNARGGQHPDVLRAAAAALEAGADGITVHLREDARHIRRHDVEALARRIAAPLNLEMALTEEMTDIACRIAPHAVCLVPERREELTTEGGLRVAVDDDALRARIARLRRAGCRVSLFVDPDPEAVRAAAAVGADAVELHTGLYCNSVGRVRASEFQRVRVCAMLARACGLECHAGHGLDPDTAASVAAIGDVAELNIGHWLVGEAVFTGLGAAVRRLRERIDAARAGTSRILRPAV